jgi:hypothetical protein
MYNSSLSMDLARIQCQLTMIVFCSLRDNVHQELHIPLQCDQTNDFTPLIDGD